MQFTKRYPPPLRPTILQHILATTARVAPSVSRVSDEAPRATEHDTPDQRTEPPLDAPESRSTEATSATDVDAVYAHMAKAANLDLVSIRRCIEFSGDHTPDIRIILQDDSLARRQVAYSVLYLRAKEAAGKQGATSRELQIRCRAKKSFNSPNFTRNFKVSTYVLPYGGKPGTANQEWVLTAAGREQAIAVLRQLLEQL